MTTTKKKADPLVAAETILIEGKAFERGEKVTGVDKDELARAVSQRRVIRQSVFDAQGVPAPDIGGSETEVEGYETDTPVLDTASAAAIVANGGSGQ